jgi:hypothetical protein
MANSVIYAGIFGAVLASRPSIGTCLVVFDTAVVDLTEELGELVELLFGAQLGGGTDINQALACCRYRCRCGSRNAIWGRSWPFCGSRLNM